VLLFSLLLRLLSLVSPSCFSVSVLLSSLPSSALAPSVVGSLCCSGPSLAPPAPHRFSTGLFRPGSLPQPLGSSFRLWCSYPRLPWCLCPLECLPASGRLLPPLGLHFSPPGVLYLPLGVFTASRCLSVKYATREQVSLYLWRNHSSFFIIFEIRSRREYCVSGTHMKSHAVTFHNTRECCRDHSSDSLWQS